MHLLENGYSPYDGDICHEVLLSCNIYYVISPPLNDMQFSYLQPPLVLYYFKLVLSFGQWSVYVHYIVSEV